MNQDLWIYIYSVRKESEAYLEQKTLHCKNAANIAVNSDSITPQKGGGVIEEYFWEILHIPLN